MNNKSLIVLFVFSIFLAGIYPEPLSPKANLFTTMLLIYRITASNTILTNRELRLKK
jgi:hypothetical protein